MDVARHSATAPAVTIVIPTWNACEGLLKCLKALGANTPGLHYEVIVVDNGSTDATSKVLSQLSFVRVLTNATNLGFARACNQGAAQARAPMIVFLNDDTQPQAGWLPPLINALKEDPSVGLASSKLIHIDTRIEQAGYALAYASPYPITPLPQFRRQPFAAITQNRRFLAVTASCLLMPAGLFRQLEGFDEGFINGMEDVDLCLRAQKRNFDSVVVGSSLVLHEPRFPAERTAFTKQNIERLNQRWGLQALSLDVDFRKFTRALPRGPQRPPWSVVVVAQDALASGAACVEHLLACTQAQDEIIFVDDCASKALSQWAQNRLQEERRLRRVVASGLATFVEAARMGLAQAQQPHCLVMPTTLRLDAEGLAATIAEASSQDTGGIVVLGTRTSRPLSALGPYEPHRPVPRSQAKAPPDAPLRLEIPSAALAGDTASMSKAFFNLGTLDAPAALPTTLQRLAIPMRLASEAAAYPFAACDDVVTSTYRQSTRQGLLGKHVVAMIRVHAPDSLRRCLRALYAWGLQPQDIWLLPLALDLGQSHDLDLVEESHGTNRITFPCPGEAESINGILQRSTADVFALLDDQVDLAPVAADALLHHLCSQPKLALLGPLLNLLKGEQAAPQAVDLADAGRLALRLSWQNRGQRRSTMHLDPHCLFAQREVVWHLGGFDPQFGIFDYALDDLVGRARFADMFCQVALDAYAHFVGKRIHPHTTQDALANRAQLLEKWKLFRDNKGLPMATAFLPPPLAPLDDRSSLPEAQL